MRVHELLEAVPVREFVGDRDVDVRGLTHDSRLVTPGSCFVCIPGEHYDGHDFAAEAVKAGARSLLVERILGDLPVAQARVDSVRASIGPVADAFYGHPSRRLSAFGITGTNGKTTTTFLLAAILEAAGRRTAVIGTTGARLGDRLLPIERTTPEATELQALFAEIVKADGTAVAMEVSSHALDLHRVDGTHFVGVGFTNLTQDHLDYHGDLETYFDAKARLFAPAFSDRAVINVADEYGRTLAARAARSGLTVTRVATDDLPFGVGMPSETEIDADVVARDVATHARGSTFSIVTRDGTVVVELPLVGRFNVENALVAAGLALAAGIDLATVARGLQTPVAVPGRMEHVEAGQPFTVLVDYAHTPDALARLVAAARELAAGGRVLLVFGCGGDRDRAKRAPMGEVAGGADQVWLTNDNPRTEDPAAIAAAVEVGLRDAHARYEIELDRASAIDAALRAATAGDIVVVAGKGHEPDQIIGTTALPFDDRAVVRERWSQIESA